MQNFLSMRGAKEIANRRKWHILNVLKCPPLNDCLLPLVV